MKHKILHKDSHVLDLGCAPGGWAQVAAQRSASVTGIDLLPMDHIPGVHFVQGSLLDPQTLDRLLSLHKKQLFDVVLSDMAPEFSGSPSIDIPRSQDLARKALDLCLYPLLRPGGSIVLKYFQGEGDGELVKDFKKCFKMVRIEKPKASRRGSREGFLVCSKFSRPGVVNVSRII